MNFYKQNKPEDAGRKFISNRTFVAFAQEKKAPPLSTLIKLKVEKLLVASVILRPSDQ